MTSAAYYQSFLATTNRLQQDRAAIRRDRAKSKKCKCETTDTPCGCQKKTDSRVRRDRARPVCKTGKLCNDVCIPKDAECHEGTTPAQRKQFGKEADAAKEKQKHFENVEKIAGIAVAGAISGLAIRKIAQRGIGGVANDLNDIWSKNNNNPQHAANTYNENIANWNKKYAGKQAHEFTTEEWQQAHDEFQKNREEFKRKAGFDPDPGFDDRWKQSVGSGKHKPDPVKNEQGKTYHEILGVGKDASPQQIKSAYRKLAAKHHPDAGGDADKFREITEAYEKAQAHKGSARGKRSDSCWGDIEQAYREVIRQHPSIPTSYWYNFPEHDTYTAWRKPLDI